jgi:hypothetical protein
MPRLFLIPLKTIIFLKKKSMKFLGSLIVFSVAATASVSALANGLIFNGTAKNLTQEEINLSRERFGNSSLAQAIKANLQSGKFNKTRTRNSTLSRTRAVRPSPVSSGTVSGLSRRSIIASASLSQPKPTSSSDY